MMFARRRRLRSCLLPPLAGLVSLVTLSLPAFALVIDSFETPQFVTQLGLGSASNTADQSVGSLQGGERDLLVTVTSGGGTLNADVDLSIAGALSHMAAGLVRGTTLVTYDGDDNDATVLDPTGLGGLDLSNGGADGTLYVVVPFADHSAGVVITVYTDGSNCSTLTRIVPSGLSGSDFPLSLIFPFSDFTLGGGCAGVADFSNVGAITLLIDGTSLGAIDASLSTFATGNADFGDLPAVYANTLIADDGAAHVICPGLTLGSEIDAESDGQQSAGATGDDTAGTPDDEDGVVVTPAIVWSVGAPPGNGGRLDITVTGTGCLSGWIDWTMNNDFADAGELVLDNVAVSTGSATYSITLPPGAVLPADYFARFRLYARDDPGGANDCSTPKTPTGVYECGEVEDYLLSIEIPTPTPTVTPTATPTLTPTTVPVCGNSNVEFGEECDDGNLIDADGCDSNCRVTGCPNGVVTAGEQCDDGNQVNLDGCDNDCTPSICTITGGQLVPGYCATRKNDCLAEFCTATAPLETDRFGGLPGWELVCTDDDPSCDFGPVGDKACTFRVSLCYNVSDTRFPCNTVDEIGFIRFRRASPKRPIDVANRDALEAAVIGIGGVLKVGPGVPGRRAVFFEPPLATKDICTEFAEFKVPLRGKAPKYKSRRKVLVTIADPPVGISRSKRDSDVLRLICNPQ